MSAVWSVMSRSTLMTLLESRETVLAITAPDYYRGVFHAVNNPDFDPISVGVGLGLTQGIFAGLLVGCVVVFTVAWYRSRRAKYDPLMDW